MFKSFNFFTAKLAARLTVHYPRAEQVQAIAMTQRKNALGWQNFCQASNPSGLQKWA